LIKAYIGTSGYSYDDWVGKFYPKGLPREEWLSFYASKLNTVELNVTFYRTPKQSMFATWARKTPKDFHFVLKGSRFVTHMRRLHEVEESLRFFFESASPLKEKLKVVLWQLPPKFPADLKLLKEFVGLLPSKVRHAFEFRDKSWLNEGVYDILRKQNAALVFSDHPFDITEPATTDFLYMRRHGPDGKYHVAYPNRDLAKDAQLIKKYGLLSYEFFNNDVEAVGAKNALTLKEMVTK